MGRIEPGNATGLLPLRLVDKRTGSDVAVAGVEIRTSKINYQTHYRQMLADVSDRSCALLLDIAAPSQARLVGDTGDPESLHQQFIVLRSLLDRDEVSDAVSRILDQPHRRWVTEIVRVDARKSFKASKSIAKQMVSAQIRTRLPDAHPMTSRLRSLGFERRSIPTEFNLDRQSDTLDTPENRFVKFVIEEWESFLVEIADRLGDSALPAIRRVRREVDLARKRVSSWLAHPLFGEVNPLTSLPLSSPTLQRRAGYRELLRSWLSFRAGTALSWRAGSEVFGGGNKDVALLYEYWVFFELLGVVEDVFEMDSLASFNLFTDTGSRLDLRLKSGEPLDFTGHYILGREPLNVRFSYNRTFSHGAATTRREVNYPEVGSWTKRMRPDYTISLWPADFTEREAERQELMAHVHFDAKYRVDNLVGLFGSDDDPSELDDEKRAFRTNQVAKRSDLLKMHAYRDAIRRTEGAYVIYPGANPVESVEHWRSFNELLPGLGAFSLRPGATETSRELLRDFLGDVAEFVSDRTTRLDQQTYQTFRIQETSGAYRAKRFLPDRDSAGERLRKRPPAEQ
jgi:predicted component of viral defense system (DUF524 family)